MKFTSKKMELQTKKIALNCEIGISGNINLINRTQNGQFTDHNSGRIPCDLLSWFTGTLDRILNTINQHGRGLTQL